VSVVHQRGNASAGLCYCGRVRTDERKFCGVCRASQARCKSTLRAQRLAASLCTKCGDTAVASEFCVPCWFAHTASGTTAGQCRGADLFALWIQQGGLCALTGDPIAPGHNLSVDHIVPRSKGGGHDIANLRLVRVDVNRALNDMSDADFIAMCRKVVAHADRKGN
jgi:5-methylcytosine-specific restriction endonuclease McrA